MAWQADDGTIHSTEGAAKAHMANRDWMVKGVFILFFIVPVVVAKLIGWIFGLFSKLGIVGKILQTVMIAFVSPIVLAIVLAVLGGNNNLPSFLSYLFLTGSFLLPALWYWLWHYDTVKLMSASVFSNAIMLSFAICFYGYIIAGIIAAISSKAALTSFLIVAVTAVAVIVYFKTVKPYAQEAAQTTKPNPKRKFIMLIGTGVVVVLAIASAITEAVDSAAKTANFRKEHAAVFEAAKNASKQGVTAVITKLNYSEEGIPMTVQTDKGISTKWLKTGDTLTITGDAIQKSTAWFVVPVEHEGTKGFIEVDYIGIR
ncbi:MAG: hypothetical protein LBH44_09395 [Treponema sp.]|jgi:hypothetical protein|nr:hypothetical protein [Treponema sp.]